ncbi:ribosome small subunit-dependent GTPase A [Bacillus sp. CMF21]|nr:ribosome small subunit-dependent GTPase A [Bacillus sp. CMF21]
MNLFNGKQHLGWNDYFEEISVSYQPLIFGRISLEHKHLYRVMTAHGEVLASLSGKFRFEVYSEEDYPAVGDWVALSMREEMKATIHLVLPRFSKLSRKAAGTSGREQLIASNINNLFIVMALNHDFNLRRLERYLVMAWESGANPVILLTKSDLCSKLNELVSSAESIAFGVPVHPVSALERSGIEQLSTYLTEGSTSAFVGSSGAGKSTLINALIGTERQQTGEVRADDSRGRHTTTYRELIAVPKKGLLIDTPGMRELQLWDSESLQHSFEDIESLASACYFRDCGHQNEPKCAINQAIEEGNLTASRLQSYRKLQRELAYIEKKERKKANKK